MWPPSSSDAAPFAAIEWCQAACPDDLRAVSCILLVSAAPPFAGCSLIFACCTAGMLKCLLLVYSSCLCTDAACRAELCAVQLALFPDHGRRPRAGGDLVGSLLGLCLFVGSLRFLRFASARAWPH